MAYDHQEQEQLEELKAWWATYGKFVIAVLLIAALAFAGWRGYAAWSQKQALGASALYDQVEKAAQARDLGKLKEVAGVLAAEYPRSQYATMSALLVARQYADAGDAKSAEAQLQWVLDKGVSDEARALAGLHLAGLMLDQKRYDEGLKLLGAQVPGAFEALYADRRGDIYVAQQKPAEARKEYQSALDKLSAQSGALRNVVQIKLDALGEG